MTPDNVSQTGPGEYRVRDSGDAWVEGPDGRKFWGRWGAAGLLVRHPDAGVLLQHRVEWSHFGGTWGLPGGARKENESAVAGALREANEEAGVPPRALQLRFAARLDLGFWSYVTVVAGAREYFEPRIGDRESKELAWTPVANVADRDLHPGFADAWPGLRADLERRVHMVVDVANVVGARPDGWWRDRRGAAERLVASLRPLAVEGIPAEELELPHERWWPTIHAVVEGQARDAQTPAVEDATAAPLEVVRAPRDGDQSIVDTVESLASQQEETQHGKEQRAGEQRAESQHPETQHAEIVVVTSDRALRARVESLGATTRGPRWLFAQTLAAP